MERKRIVILARLCLALSLLAGLCAPAASPARAQTPTPVAGDRAAALLLKMTPEERVGQLFLMSFEGSSIDLESPIYDLVTRHHLGGVLLLAENDNFIDDGEDPSRTVRQTNNLIRQLQQAEWNASLAAQTDTASGQSFLPAYAPLLVGLSQEGGGWPYDQLLRGMSEMPNPMAIGATWTPSMATEVGDALGKELAAVGVNLLLGPSLDVIEAPQMDGSSSLGVSAFGGDPYWVALMGQNYIRGVHQGSAGRVAVAPRHFPGHGSSDRLPEEEVATVRKSLDELISFDLAPFFAVTGQAKTPAESADALMTSHIRYQGLQGNIRATTRPVSFDPQALGLLMQQPALASWRSSGGLLVSDDLGNQAIRRFYDLTSQTFDARRVTLNAFLAGNDLLNIADFSSAAEPDSALEAVRTLEFFTQKYREDAAFAQRVDASALRILTLKFRLYPNFLLSDVINPASKLSEVGQNTQVTFQVARQAATLLSPTQAELDVLIPDAPNLNDRMVFLSDVQQAQQCSTCPPMPLLRRDGLQEAVLRLYGPQAGGQVAANALSSYTFDELQTLLDAPNNDEGLGRDLGRASWIIVALMGQDRGLGGLDTLQRFLSERPDLFQQKRLIVFSFAAPYYLDATNISKLTAYYALYSSSAQFVDVAAYLLFGELRAIGASPVSVPGIGYNLNAALFPNPAQTIALEIDLPAPSVPITSTVTPEPAPPPEFRMGDVLPLRTGVIVDYNNNPVPDGTPVQFNISYGSEASSLRQVEYTRLGVARTTYLVANPGTLEIHAESETARSNILRLDIPFPGGVSPTPSNTPEPSPTSAPEPTETALVIFVTPPAAPVEQPRPDVGDWLIMLFTGGLLAWSIFRLGLAQGQMRWGIRAAILAFSGALLAYSYLALGLPGSQALFQRGVGLMIFLFSLGGSVVGLTAALIWREYVARNAIPPKDMTPRNPLT